MFTKQRGLQGGGRRGLLALTCLLMIPTLGACAPVAGGVVVAGVVGIAALTSHCYDYLDLTVIDGQGRKTCAAHVTASSDGDHFELGSCYYAPLTDGVWTVRATLPGYKDAMSTVPVEHAHDCARHVQTVELTLNPATPPGSALPAAQQPLNSMPAVSAPPPAAPPPAPVLPPAPPMPTPSGAGIAPLPASPTQVAPSPSSAPPLGAPSQ